jgi:hypothetical protein
MNKPVTDLKPEGNVTTDPLVLPRNAPVGTYDDLAEDAQAIMRFLFLALVPRPEGFTNEDHIEACRELSDAGLLWFAQKRGSEYVFKRRVAGQPDNAPWVDCSAAFAGAQ